MITSTAKLNGVCSMVDVQSKRQAHEDMDSNRALLGFENGNLDPIAGKFGPAKFEDSVAMCTNYEYLERRDPSKEAEVTRFLEQVAAARNCPLIASSYLVLCHVHGQLLSCLAPSHAAIALLPHAGVPRPRGFGIRAAGGGQLL